MNLGQSYNPAMVRDRSMIQHDAALVELGLHELSVVNEMALRETFPDLSLHIARSPMVESVSRQKDFLHTLEKVIEKNSFFSLGFHLCGARDSGIGRLGFTPHFDASEEITHSVGNFIRGVKQIFSGEIWLENANFYSIDKGRAKRAYQFLSNLAQECQTGIILDLSHVAIEASNLRISPCGLLAEIDLSLVREIHLSGIVSDSHGVLHDGHSQAVAVQTWNLLEIISPEIANDCFITIEHSDPIFFDRREQFDADFEQLRRWLENRSPALRQAMEPDSYAKKYLAKILVRHTSRILNIM